MTMVSLNLGPCSSLVCTQTRPLRKEQAHISFEQGLVSASARAGAGCILADCMCTFPRFGNAFRAPDSGDYLLMAPQACQGTQRAAIELLFTRTQPELAMGWATSCVTHGLEAAVAVAALVAATRAGTSNGLLRLIQNRGISFTKRQLKHLCEAALPYQLRTSQAAHRLVRASGWAEQDVARSYAVPHVHVAECLMRLCPRSSHLMPEARLQRRASPP